MYAFSTQSYGADRLLHQLSDHLAGHVIQDIPTERMRTAIGLSYSSYTYVIAQISSALPSNALAAGIFQQQT